MNGWVTGRLICLFLCLCFPGCCCCCFCCCCFCACLWSGCVTCWFICILLPPFCPPIRYPKWSHVSSLILCLTTLELCCRFVTQAHMRILLAHIPHPRVVFMKPTPTNKPNSKVIIRSLSQEQMRQLLPSTFKGTECVWRILTIYTTAVLLASFRA